MRAAALLLLFCAACEKAPAPAPSATPSAAPARPRARQTTKPCADGCAPNQVCVASCCNGPCTPAMPFCVDVDPDCSGKPACECAGALCSSSVPGVTCKSEGARAVCVCPPDPR